MQPKIDFRTFLELVTVAEFNSVLLLPGGKVAA